jgi:hypothetical protein
VYGLALQVSQVIAVLVQVVAVLAQVQVCLHQVVQFQVPAQLVRLQQLIGVRHLIAVHVAPKVQHLLAQAQKVQVLVPLILVQVLQVAKAVV